MRSCCTCPYAHARHAIGPAVSVCPTRYRPIPCAAAQFCESVTRIGHAELCSSSTMREEGLWQEGRRPWGYGMGGERG